MGTELAHSKNPTQKAGGVPLIEPSPGPHFSLRALLIATMIICILLAVLVPQVRHSRQAGWRVSCSNNLKEIGLAFQNYHDSFRTYPPAITYAADGTPMHSWRVLILPFVEQTGFPSAYDYQEPWNGPRNRLLADEIPDRFLDNRGRPFPCVRDATFYRCPGAPYSQDRWRTNYVMLIDDRPGRPNGPPNLPGSIPPGRKPHSAVIVIEIAESDILWLEPRDVLLSELSMRINDRSKRSLSSYHGGACILHTDGQVEILDEDVTEERLRDLLTQ